MITAFDTNDLTCILLCIKKMMDAERENLIEMDNALGDGDLGITMTRAFSTVADDLKTSEEIIPAKLFIRIGMTIAKAAPSTMGTLLGTGFMRGGKCLNEKDRLGLDDLAIFFRHFVSGIMDRGKAKPGDKTIIDVLNPVALSLLKSAQRDASLIAAFSEAFDIARAAVEITTMLEAQHGRAAYYREASVGKKDGGAFVGLLIVKGFYEYLRSSDLQKKKEPE